MPPLPLMMVSFNASGSSSTHNWNGVAGRSILKSAHLAAHHLLFSVSPPPPPPPPHRIFRRDTPSSPNAIFSYLIDEDEEEVEDEVDEEPVKVKEEHVNTVLTKTATPTANSTKGDHDDWVIDD